MGKKLLLLSNSVIPGLGYLEYAKEHIREFYGSGVKKIAFVPYAGVTVPWDAYEDKVSEVFEKLGFKIYSLHHEENPVSALDHADGIAVGGGNTFKLLHDLHKTGLLEAIRRKVIDGVPYCGWSAGSNVACPTICTTNDMPVIQPASFNAMDLVPFQINPHYLDANPEGHGGETREQRILEFLELNPWVTVVGLREGTILKFEDQHIELIGDRSARIFRYGTEPYEMDSESKFDFLMEA